MDDDEIDTMLKRDLVVAIIIFFSMAICHELGHWLVFTICHWEFRDQGFYATIGVTWFALYLIPNKKMPMFDPLVVIGGLLGTWPFRHLWSRVGDLPKAVIVIMNIYSLVEILLYFIGSPIGLYFSFT